MQPNPEGQKCSLHPKHIIIGVCAYCLNERLLLLLLASKQQQQEQLKQQNSNFNNLLSKLFAFTSLLTTPFDNQTKKTQDATAASTSQEDSFISIEFEGSGVGSWEKKNTKPKVSIEQHHHHNNYISSFNQISLIKGEVGGGVSAAVIEHSKMGVPLRWRKRIGHIFQIIRWKRPTKGKGKGHVPSNIEGHVKVRQGWVRSLTIRRTKY